MSHYPPHRRKHHQPSALPIITDGLVLYWPFDEGAGTVVHDVVSGHDLTMYNIDESAWVPARNNYALNFNAADAYLEAPYHTDFDFLSPMTLFVDCQPTGETGNEGNWGGGLISRWSVGHTTPAYAILYEYSNRRLRFSYFNTNSARLEMLLQIPYGQWARIATVDRVAQGEDYLTDGATSHIYHNGVDERDKYWPARSAHNSPLRVGQSLVNLLDRNFVGLIAEIRAYDRELSDAEMIALTTGNG